MTNLEPEGEPIFEPEGKPVVTDPFAPDSPVAGTPRSKSGKADARTSGSEGSTDGAERRTASIQEQERGHTGPTQAKSRRPTPPPSPSSPSSGPSTPQPTSSPIPSTGAKKDRDGLVAALKSAANEMSADSLRKKKAPVVVTQHDNDKELFSFATSPEQATVGRRFGVTSHQVATVEVAKIGNQDVVKILSFGNLAADHATNLKRLVADLTDLKVTLQSPASEGAHLAKLKGQAGAMLKTHNIKTLEKTQVGQDLEIDFYPKQKVSLCGDIAPGSQLAAIASQYGGQVFLTFKFRKTGQNKWLEVGGREFTSKHSNARKHLKDLFEGMTCTFR